MMTVLDGRLEAVVSLTDDEIRMDLGKDNIVVFAIKESEEVASTWGGQHLFLGRAQTYTLGSLHKDLFQF